MGLAKTVSMKFPTKNHGGIRLILTDDQRPDLGPGPQTVIDEEILENYSGDITQAVIDSLVKQAQKKVDAYRERRDGFDKTEYQDAATTIDGLIDTTKAMVI
jgi:hypothetical protein